MSARPPGVVSGEPNITPIFSRSWLMKIAVVSNFDSEPVSFRIACDIRRACSPTWVSPISPSISARGTSAATESITTSVERARAHEHVGDLERLLAAVGLGDEELVDVDPERTRVGGIERVLGVDERRDPAGPLGLGDDVQADRGLARALRARRPRRCARGGCRRSPSARSSESDPVGIDPISTFIGCSPSFITAPLPCCFSICWSVTSSILSRSTRSSFRPGPTPEGALPARDRVSAPDERSSTLATGSDISYTPVIRAVGSDPPAFGSNGREATRTGVRTQAPPSSTQGERPDGLVDGRRSP